MTQEKKAGYKEFFIALIVVILLYILVALLRYIIPNKIVSSIIGIIIFCYYGYFVLVRYAAIYTYTIEQKKIKIERKIGHRTKSAEIKKREIVLMTYDKPNTKQIYNFSRFIKKRDKIIYVVFINDGNREALIMECDDEMKTTLKEYGYIESAKYEVTGAKCE